MIDPKNLFHRYHLTSLAIALSGGADSMALTLLAKAAGARFTTLTVDHALRPESGAEAAQVAAWMQALDIPHTTLRWAHSGIHANMQEKAREARYRLMSAWCRENGVCHLLTAHHRDDQAETLLLRLKRGSHVRGLSGMARESSLHGITLHRPLLEVPKSSLIQYLRARGQPWLEDPSNASPQFDRVRARDWLHSLSNAEDMIQALAHSATALAQEHEKEAIRRDAFLNAYCQLSHSVATFQHDAFVQLDESLALAVLSHLLVQLSGSPHPPRFSKLEPLYRAIRSDARLKRTLLGIEIQRKNNAILLMRIA